MEMWTACAYIDPRLAKVTDKRTIGKIFEFGRLRKDCLPHVARDSVSRSPRPAGR